MEVVISLIADIKTMQLNVDLHCVRKVEVWAAIPLPLPLPPAA